MYKKRITCIGFVLLAFISMGFSALPLPNEQTESTILITDQSFYASGELLTFHTFTVPSMGTTETSNYIYIDFVGPDGTVISHQKIRTKGRIGKGELKLPGDLPTGTYRFYSYTATMFSAIEKLAGQTTVAIYNSDNMITSEEIVDIPFQINTRAEGGNLLVGRKAKIFYNVRGTSVVDMDQIELIDIDGKVVFTIDKDRPSGIIELTPSTGQSYRFNINHSGNLFPKVAENGLVLSVEEKGDSFEVSLLSTNFNSPVVQVIARQNGQNYFNDEINISENGRDILQIFKSSIPDGKITIEITHENKILSSRLVLNTWHNELLDVELTLKNEFYKRENVDVITRVEWNGKPVESTSFLVVNSDASDGEENKTGELLKLYFPGTKWKIAGRFNSVNDFLIGLEPEITIKNPVTYYPEIKQTLSCIIDPDSPGFSEELSFVSAYFINDIHTSEARVENGVANFKIQDTGNDNLVWFYGLNNMGNRLGEIYVSSKDLLKDRHYEELLIKPEINNQVITYLNNLRQKDRISKVYGKPNIITEIEDMKDEADIIVSPDAYTDLESLKEFIVSVVPKASVKRKKGRENVVLMPSYSHNHFKESPIYFIDNYPTFDGSAALNLDLQNVDYIEIINSLNNMAAYGMLGRNGIFKITTKVPTISKADTLLSKPYFIKGLDFSYNTNDNQVLKDRSNVNFPDFRSLLYTSLPYKSDVGGTNAFSFHTSDLTGKYKVKVYGITGDGIIFTESSAIEVIVPIK